MGSDPDEVGGGFPADLATEAGLIAGGVEGAMFFEETEEGAAEEVLGVSL